MKPTEIGATFQIPKFEAQAELLLADNRQLKGKLFLSILPSSPLGHTSVLDWLNEPTGFFPFVLEKTNEAVILNKRLLVSAVVASELNQDDVSEMLEQTTWIEQVEVHCDPYFSHRGQVLLNLPPNRARVLDFLNEPLSFFTLKDGKQSHIINKRYITLVRELSSLPEPKPKRSSRRASKK